MGTEAMERVWNWKANQKCQQHQQNDELKANRAGKDKPGSANTGRQVWHHWVEVNTGEAQWQPGVSSIDWEPTEWSTLKRGARRIWGSSAGHHTVYLLLPPVFRRSRWWFFSTGKMLLTSPGCSTCQKGEPEITDSAGTSALPLRPLQPPALQSRGPVRSQLQKPGQQPGPHSARSSGHK